jgi:adenosylcobinamide-GDP ribazoletransferase
MNKEIRVFFTALMYFTRIPCPKWVDHSEEYLNKASRYFPLMGWIVGGGAALVFWGSTYIVPIPIAILLSMTFSVLITGAFHEDGLADVCDGFGGGWTKEKILDIMKDSRVGAFGVIGLLLVMAMKFLALEYTANNVLALSLLIIAGHSLSRFVAVTFLYTHEYARIGEQSKSKPLATKLTMGHLILAKFFGVAPLIVLAIVLKNYWVIILIVPVYLTKVLLGRFFKKWIGGYTGDCLGATQQICEVVFYLSILVLWKFM